MKKILYFACLTTIALVSCGKQEAQDAQSVEVANVVEESALESAKEEPAKKKETVKDDAVVVPEISETDAVFTSDEDVMKVLDGVVFYNTDGKDPGASVAFRNGQFIHNDGVTRSVMTPTMKSRGDDRAIFSIHDDAMDELGIDVNYTVTFYGRDNVIILDMVDQSFAFALAKDIEN